ncbi:hypothetical protein BBJ28_00017074 [Nothophytophthora sp. Chile5]|nr:hypothetical protein BBJ28_00017074 [Nothophytophthora sp. Chile5]
MPPRLSRPVRWLVVLGTLGLLVVTTNFVFTWRATSVERARAEEHLAGLHGDQAGNSVKNSDGKAKRNEEDGGGGREPMLRQSDGGTSNDFSVEQLQLMEKQLVYTLHQVAQTTSEPRGIVLPLFDGIAALGLSLIMELRAMSVDLPVEVPHCGDLSDSLQRTVGEKDDLGVVRFYDVCELAAQTSSALDASRKVFCQSMRNCHRSFRSFDIKLLAVAYSRFEELMLLDADTIFFETPMSLWDSEKYRTTGTLFFHDRLSQDNMFLGNRVRGKPDVSELNEYMSRFDVSPFAPLGNIPRPKATSPNAIAVTLNFSPSEHLLTSHSWNHRAGHEMDSSLVLWSKTRQPRATAMLTAFAALNGVGRPPSYGDKELFFVACELAETQYAFSDFGVGGVGSDFRDHGPGKSVVCGHAAHYYPVKPVDPSAVANTSVLYLNSDSILEYDPKKKPVYYSQARLYEVYAGSFVERDLPQECPFDVTGVALSPAQEDRVLLRQRFHEIAAAWME